MPETCAAWGCKSRRNIHTKSKGITFHKFPREKALRRQWEVTLRRKGFSASGSSVLCSLHFKPEDFDCTGQTVRLRNGVKPSVFIFPTHLQRKPVAAGTTRTSRKAKESPSVDCSPHTKETEHPPNVDHSYALHESPTDLKARVREALSQVESLEQEMRKAKEREQRAKDIVDCLLRELRRKSQSPTSTTYFVKIKHNMCKTKC